MARKKFNKKTAVTYSVVHRSHEDSLYYDNDASKHVLVAKSQSQEPKIVPKGYSSRQLETQLDQSDLATIRDNEGLAAQYGIFYDDSKYDYMQHLRPMGQQKDAVFIPRTSKDEKTPKKKLDDLLEDVMPSKTTRRAGHDDLENIPHELQGFNPDMDGRLREVLEALEDDAYVDTEDVELDDLLKSGEVDLDEFYDDEDFDEWDMDNYDDDFSGADDESGQEEDYEELELENPYNDGEAPIDAQEEEEGDVTAPSAAIHTGWERDFARFKKQAPKQNDWDSDDEFEDEGLDTLADLPATSQTGSKKKQSKTKTRRKMGAMTDTLAFSMTSSALFRTEGLTLLDDRFEKLNALYEKPNVDQDYTEFDMKDERPDLEGMLDEFLDTYELGSGGRKLVKKNAEVKRLQKAADLVSKGKAAERRRREDGADKLGASFGKMKI